MYLLTFEFLKVFKFIGIPLIVSLTLILSDCFEETITFDNGAPLESTIDDIFIYFFLPLRKLLNSLREFNNF